MKTRKINYICLLLVALFINGCAQPELEIRTKEPVPTAVGSLIGTTFLTKMGSVYTLGRDRTTLGFYQTILGQGEGITSSEEPVKILSDVVKIESNQALKKNGELWVWGTNDDCLIGLPEETEVAYKPVLLLMDVVDFNYNCALKSNGELWGWHWTAYADPVTGEPASTTPVKIASGVKAFCKNAFVKQDGSLWVYGNSRYKSEYYSKPVKTAENVISCSVETQSGQILYIKSDGSLWGFGNNEYGQVGNGDYGDMDINTYDCIVNEPIKIMDEVVSVYAKLDSTYAITEDGELWGWGRNISGMLGTDNEFEPLPIKIFTDKIKSLYIPIIPVYGYLIDDKDTLWGWGAMPVGDGQGVPIGTVVPYSKTANELKTNFVSNLKKPAKVLENVECAVGNTSDGYRVVLTKDGTYYRWGIDTYTRAKTYGEANVIVFCTFKADGTQDKVTGVWSSLIDTGYTGKLGAPDEEIVGGIGYVYSQILTPEPCEFPG